MNEIKLPEIQAERLEQLLKEDVKECIAEVTEAMNRARTGTIINDSEELVRIATAKLRQKIFQKALQMKTDVAQAAFSPSQHNKHKK
jgi:hypothetical protein